MKKGWEVEALGEICEFYNGKAHEKNINENGKFKVVNSKFVSSNGKTYKRTEVAKFPLFTDDIVMVMSDVPNGKTLAKCFLIDKDDTYSLNQRVCAIRTTTFDKRFLYYQLNRNKYLLDFNNGKNQTNLRKNDILNCKLFVPSIKEQKSIVAILDKAFATIAKARANAEQNLKNAKELFESSLQGVFENKGEGWKELKLSELAKDITDGDHSPPPKTEEGLPFITISNINKQTHQIDFSNTFKVSKGYFKKLKENKKPKKGDVLYTVTGSYGIPVLIENDFEFCFQRHIGLIRPKENVNSKWLYYWILSPQAFFQANDTATGTAQKTVSLTALRNFKLPKTSLKEQKTIVKKLDALSTKTKKLENIYQQKIDNLEELKKSILQKAFNGELT